MYPDVERVFRGDVRTLKMFCKVAQPVHVPALEQTEKHFMTEFNYRKEAIQQDIIRNNLMKAGLAGDQNDQKFVIPKIYLDYCTKRVMVMEYIDGEKLIDALLKDTQSHATYQGKTVEQLRHEEELLDSQARAKGELRFGPTVEEFNSYIALLDAKRRAHNLGASLYNATVSWWLPGAKTMDIHGKNLLPLNQAQIVDDLNFIHGHQVLIDGVFNGDPRKLFLLGNMCTRLCYFVVSTL
jgi:aarF domain-containing kinase